VWTPYLRQIIHIFQLVTARLDSTWNRTPSQSFERRCSPRKTPAPQHHVAFLISATASLIRLIGKSDRNPNALVRKRDRKVQPCAMTVGIDCSPKTRMVCGTDQFKGPPGCQLIRLFGS